MNDTKTLETLRALRLPAMADVFETALHLGTAHSQSPSELLAFMVEAELNNRAARKTQRLLKQASLRIPASLDAVNLADHRGIPQGLFTALASLEWVTRGHTVLITGKTGVGKSFLACALAHESCMKGLKTRYFSAAKLLMHFRMAQGDASYLDELKQLARYQMLVIDDFCLDTLDRSNCLILYDILEDRYRSKATIITSQLPVSAWHSQFQDPTLADSIMDRLAHTPYKITIEGESMRKIHNTD